MRYAVFDEASVSTWQGRDLREASQIPNMDLIVVAVRQDNMAELNRLLNTGAGLMSYLARFWQGFYPLLLVELQSSQGSIETVRYA